MRIILKIDGFYYSTLYFYTGSHNRKLTAIMSLVFSYLIVVTKSFAILPQNTTLSPLQHNEVVMSAAGKIGASSHLFGTVYGFNDDEKEEIQIQSGFWVGRALLGPLCQRRPIL